MFVATSFYQRPASRVYFFALFNLRKLLYIIVRRLDNKNAIVLIRGEKPVIDEKYDILKHPNIHRTEDGGAPPYLHTPLRAFAADDLSFSIENIDDIEFLED